MHGHSLSTGHLLVPGRSERSDAGRVLLGEVLMINANQRN